MKNTRGFSLIELLVAVAILAIIMAVAAPSFQDASVSGKVSDNANRLASSAAMARGEAIKRNTPVILCKSSDGATCADAGGWEQGWMIFHDANRDGAKGADEPVLLQEAAAPTGYKITESGGKSALTFQPTSVGTTSAQWTVCRATPSVHPQQRQVEVSTTGRPSVKKTQGTTCA